MSSRDRFPCNEKSTSALRIQRQFPCSSVGGKRQSLITNPAELLAQSPLQATSRAPRQRLPYGNIGFRCHFARPSTTALFPPALPPLLPPLLPPTLPPPLPRPSTFYVAKFKRRRIRNHVRFCGPHTSETRSPLGYPRLLKMISRTMATVRAS